MKNYVGELVKAYYQCLDGNITYDGQQVNIYNVAVAANETFHHIVLRPESEFDSSNKSSFVTNPVIVADVITVHHGAIDAGVVEEIDNAMRELIFTARNTTGLTITGDFQVLNVRIESTTYLDGFDGSKHEHRKISRFTHTLNQI